MEEILRRARELGLLIRESGEYREFRESEKIMLQDPELADAYRRYGELAGDLARREESGVAVESWERQELVSLAGRLGSAPPSARFMDARKAYGELLAGIQAALEAGLPGTGERQ